MKPWGRAAAALGAALVILAPAAPATAAKPAAGGSALAAGRAAFEDGLYPLAEKQFQRYIRQATNRDERAAGTLWLARARLGRKQYERAYRLLAERSSWAEGTASAAGFVLWRAHARFEQGKYGDALTLTERFSEKFPDTPERGDVTRLRARCFVRMKRFDDALDACARYQSKFGDGADAADNLLDWAATLIEMDRPDDALEILARLAKTHPASDAAAQGRLWMGRLYAAKRQWDKVTEILRPLAEQKDAAADRRAAAWLALAEAGEAGTNLAASISALEQGGALAADPALKLKADVARGKLLVRAGRAEEGAALLRQCVRAFGAQPQAAETQLDLAQALLDQKMYRNAEEEFQHYLEAFDDRDGQAWALLGKGWSLWGLERYAESASVFEKAYHHHTNAVRKAQALFKVADSCFANSQYKLAADRYDQFAKEFPSEPLVPQARLQSAECLARQGRRADAEAALQAVAEAGLKEPLAQLATLRIAQLKEEAGAWELAGETYDRVAGVCSNAAICARALQGRGLIRYRLGRFQDALADFERIISDYGQSEFAEQAFFMRGWCQYLLGRDEEAVRINRSFLDQYPKSKWAPDVVFWLAEYHFNRGEYGAAEERFASLAAQYPDGPLADQALFWAGRAASATKDYLRAIEHYNGLTKNHPQSPLVPETRFAQGDTLTELGQFDGAILAFDEVIRKFPRSHLVDLAWGRKGDCQFTLGKDDPKRYREAAASYQVVRDSAQASPELKAQADYKIGRCWEKMGKRAEAFEHYMNLVYRFLAERKEGAAASPLWFTRAAFSAAAIKENEEQWQEAANIYRRVVDAGVPAAGEARVRVDKILAEHGTDL